MNRLILFTLVLISSVMLYAQNTTTTVKGTLIDSLTMEPEPYATIKIARKEAPQKAVKMAVTDMNGQFAEKIPGTGNFLITITSVGKTTVSKEFTLTAGGQAIYDLGTLHTADASNELGVVEVVAQKPLVKVDIDKIEYNIEDDPDSKSNSLLEMLRKVPLVTVDAEDNIQVNGSSNFKVYVNGKPNNMMSDNPKEVLRSMPANNIKHIEVITDPGAKYDAEGVGGILNIVTVAGSGIEGYTATFTGRVTNTELGGSLYGTVKKGKLTVSGNYSYSYDDRPKSFSENVRKEDTGNVTESYGWNKGTGNFQMGNLEASYELDTLRLFSLSFGMYGGGNDSDSHGENWMTEGANSDPTYAYKSKNSGDGSWYAIRGNVDYQRLFSVKDRMLTISYRINSRPRTNDSFLRFYDKSVPDVWEGYLNLKDWRIEQDNNNTEHTFQADYVTPFKKYHTLEAGVKYILRTNESDTKHYDVNGESETINSTRSSDFKHQNDILAAYAGYALRYKSISGKVGLRYEHTMQDVKFYNRPEQNFDVNFSDFVPNASVGLKLGQTSNLRAGYNLRIWRPSIWNLNPYVDQTNPTHHSKGNPNLESEKSHALNISYSSFTSKFNINLSLRHSFVNNSIERVTRLDNNNHIMLSTYENIGKSGNTGLSAYVNWNASPKTRIYANLNGGYNTYDSKELGLKNEGWSFFSYGGLQHTFPWELRGTLNFYYSAPSEGLQEKWGEYYGYNLSINKSFMKEKRLTLSVFAGNFFQKYQKHEGTTFGQGFETKSTSKYPSRRFGISVSYRIGELKAQVKKASRSIHNDDVKEGDGGGGGGAAAAN